VRVCVVVRTYKHGGHVVRERVGDDGEAGRDERRGAERFHHANHQTDNGERNPVRTAVHEPCTNTLVRRQTNRQALTRGRTDRYISISAMQAPPTAIRSRFVAV